MPPPPPPRGTSRPATARRHGPGCRRRRAGGEGLAAALLICALGGGGGGGRSGLGLGPLRAVHSFAPPTASLRRPGRAASSSSSSPDVAEAEAPESRRAAEARERERRKGGGAGAENKKKSRVPATLGGMAGFFKRGKKADADAIEATTRWTAWMVAGKPRGVADIKMRDDADLGGLPRSDRYSSRDWWHNTVTLPNSSILRAVINPVLVMSIWAQLISVLHMLAYSRNPPLAGHMTISTSPHSLMVSALGLLLVFRTNSAYQRFSEGRKIWEGILNVSRDLSRMCKLYEDQIGRERRRRVQALLAAFPYLLRYRIRPDVTASFRKVGTETDGIRNPEYSLFLYQDLPTKENDSGAAIVAAEEEMTGMSRRKERELYWVDKRTLPWRLLPGDAMEKCGRAQNRPLWVCDRLATELRTVPDQGLSFTNRERMMLLTMVDKLSNGIGSCERIHQTVVPLNYARHALRSLTVWLLSLPFALVDSLGLFTGTVVFAISWMLFGVYEIGTRIEDPFQGTLRLSILCDQIRRDVLSDDMMRETAFTIDLPKKKEEGGEGGPQLARDGDEDEEEEGKSVNTKKKKGKVDEKVREFMTNIMEADIGGGQKGKINGAP